VDEAESILVGTGIYQRAGHLVRVDELPDHVSRIERARGTAGICPLSQSVLLDVLSRAAVWKAWNGRSRRHVTCWPDDKVARVLLDRGSWRFPALRGVITAPTIKASGEVLDKPGYDAETGLILMHSGRWPRVRASPTKVHAQEALKELAEVVHDFPFAAPAHRSGAIAAILSVACRTFYQGDTPLYVIGARDAGTGKTRLAEVVSIIGTGHGAPRITPWAKPDEGLKTLFSMALYGDPIGLLDNWPTGRPIGDEALDGALTANGNGLRNRILGKSEMGTAEWNTILMVTGNNVSYAGDTVRRVIPIDLDARVENPEERTGFLHDPLLPWVEENRKRLVVACITILRAWHLAGRPKPATPTMGSFESWSDTIRQALAWLGVNDPCEMRQELRETSDPNREALKVLLIRWREVWGGEWKLATTIKEHLEEGKGDSYDDLREAFDALMPRRKTEHPTSKQIGSFLPKILGAVRDGRRVDRSKDRHSGLYYWRVEEVK